MVSTSVEKMLHLLNSEIESATAEDRMRLLVFAMLFLTDAAQKHLGRDPTLFLLLTTLTDVVVPQGDRRSVN